MLYNEWLIETRRMCLDLAFRTCEDQDRRNSTVSSNPTTNRLSVTNVLETARRYEEYVMRDIDKSEFDSDSLDLEL